MTSESPPASRSVQALRSLFVETPLMGIPSGGIPHPRLIKKDPEDFSPPPNVTPLKIPRPVIASKPLVANKDIVSIPGKRSPQPPKPSQTYQPEQTTPLPKTAPELPPPRVPTPNKFVTTRNDTKSPASSLSSVESSRQDSPVLAQTTASSGRQRGEVEVRLQSDSAKGSANSNLNENIKFAEGSEKRTYLVTTSDNYVCNSGTQKLVWQRRPLPSLKELGPPPAKPPRPVNLVLQQGESIQPPPRAKRPSQNWDVKFDAPAAVRAPMPLPPPLEEELYGDTGLPDEPPSPIPEFTEDEEYQLYADTGTPPPPPLPPPVSRRPSTPTEEIYQDSSLGEELYEEMPCSKNTRSPSPTFVEQKEESAQEKKEREKREAAARKTQRKFGMTGMEEPLDVGIVKSSCRGGRLDLSVKKGETLHILRMENNPPGKWLVRNSKGEVGYAGLANIEVMVSQAQSMGNLNSDFVVEQPHHHEEEEEAIYEVTY